MKNKVSPLLANGISGLLAGGIATAIITTLTVTTGILTTLAIGGGTTIDKIILQSSVVDVDSLSNGASTSSVITVTGATLGDFVDVSGSGSWGSPTSSVMVMGTVTATDTVTLQWHNTSGTAVNLTNASYKINVTSP